VPRAIDVRIVALGRLILDVGGVDRDPAGFFLGCRIDLAIGEILGIALFPAGRFPDHAENVADGRGKGRLAVIDVADRADVHVNAVAIEFFFCHCFSSKMVFL
jgi:hypothetical protein